MIFDLIFYVVILMIAIPIIGFIIDFVMRDKYVIKKKYYRKGRGVGAGQEYYYEYWFWQPYKKKVLKNTLYQLGVAGVYEGKSRTNNKYIRMIKKEVYGVV